MSARSAAILNTIVEVAVFALAALAFFMAVLRS